MKLLLAIRSLDIGGAERQFIELVRHIDKSRFNLIVCTMYSGSQEESLKAIDGITYYNLKKQGRYDLLDFGYRYRKLLRSERPDIIYSFLSEMNLFSLWCKPRNSKIVWGFRASDMDLKQYGKLPQLLFWLQKISSPYVDRIIANSHASIAFHTDKGFDMSRAMVIANGIDTQRYAPDTQARKSFRAHHGLNEDDIAIGICARIDPMKGYLLLAEATKTLLEKHSNLVFFSAGGGDEKIKAQCAMILNNHPRFIWLGNQNNMPAVYAGWDIAVSASLSEGFSNTIAEAMSCALPVLATDVGDSAVIVLPEIGTVEPGSADALEKGIESLLHHDLKTLGSAARAHILERFHVTVMVQKTEETLHDLLQ